MFVHRVQSTYGRLVPKPEKDEVLEEINEDAIPIQDQIEALRTKIQLKERYNRVLREELEESRLGASSILQDLYSETKTLRIQLVDAINSEKAAVQNALRTHREFQLAMSDKIPLFAIAWLEDKLFDFSKILNIHLNRLQLKRRKLEEAESMVMTIEKWPRPGTLPWELDAYATFHRIENHIENVLVKLETANILHSKFHEVKYLLREEKGKYAPILRSLDDQVNVLKHELIGLQKMLDDAIYFRDDAIRNLAVTEKEASENRKRRRKQMTKMKKAVQKVLEANQAHPVPVIRKGYLDQKIDEDNAKPDFLETLRLKRVEVEKYQDRARHLVETMRVPDLTHIPNRFRNVMTLGERLQMEQESKEQLRDLLLRQKDQLYLILCHFSYTGIKSEKEFNDRVNEFTEAIRVANQDCDEARRRLQKYGNTTVDLRLASLALLNRLDDGKRRHYLRKDFYHTIKMVQSKTKKLVGAIASLEEIIKVPPTKNYGMFVRNPPIPARLVRVGSPVVSDNSDDEDMIDLKVPGRAEIKAKSLRVIHQGVLKRGFR